MQLYLLTFPNGKRYVGVTVDLQHRLRGHKSGRTSALTRRAWRKHGAPKAEILVIGEREYIYGMEHAAIEQYGTRAPAGYNLADGGCGGVAGPISEEHRARISAGMKAYHRTEAAKAMVENRPAVSDETRQKLARSRTGRTASKESRERMSQAQKGRTFSDEARRRMSKAHRGRKLSEATRAKMAESQRARRALERKANR